MGEGLAMSTVEIALSVLTGVTVLVMLNRTWDIAVSGVRFWLRPGLSLLIRAPIFLLAIACIAGGIELVYDINARVCLPRETADPGFVGWLLIFIHL